MRETGSEKEGEWEREGREGVCACVRDTEETTDRVSVRERGRERERLREIERERERSAYIRVLFVRIRARYAYTRIHAHLENSLSANIVCAPDRCTCLYSRLRVHLFRFVWCTTYAESIVYVYTRIHVKRRSEKKVS